MAAAVTSGQLLPTISLINERYTRAEIIVAAGCMGKVNVILLRGNLTIQCNITSTSKYIPPTTRQTGARQLHLDVS